MPVVVDQEQILIGRKKYERNASLGKSLNDIVKRYWTSYYVTTQE